MDHENPSIVQYLGLLQGWQLHQG